MTAKQSIFGNIQYQNSSNVPKLLWTSLFDGTIAITTPDNDPTIYYYTGNITGADSRGHGVGDLASAFGVGGTFQAQYIMDDILVDHPLSDIFVTTIRPSTFIDGIGNEVEIRQVARNSADWSGSRPQCEFTIELSDSTSAINEYYCSKLFTVPDNILDILDRPDGAWTVAWMEIEAVKCGPATSNDARVSVQLIKVKNESGLRLRAQLDNNGTDTVTGVTDGVIAGLDADGVIDYGQTDEGAILPGKQYRLDYWIKRSAGRADLETGRFVADVTRLDTKEKFNIIDKTGGQFWGYYSYHFKRFFPVLCYTGGFPSAGDITIKYSNIQYWSKPPRNISFTTPVEIDTSLAGGTTQPREGTDTLSIDFTSSTPSQVIISRNDNPTFAVWPDGAMSESFTAVTGGLEFDLSLAHMNLGVNTIGIKASYADYRKATDALSLTIEAVTPEPVTKTITVSMLGGLNQTREGRDVFQIDFTSGTPTSLIFARNDNATFAEWPTGNLNQYFTEVTGGLEFDLDLVALNLGSNTLAVSATYSDASTATDSLSLVLTEVDAGEVTLGILPWVPTPLASATMFASPTGNDANPGTFASPKTFQGAITAATPGSVVFLRGGTYPVTDAAHIQAWAVGTAGAPIIFESYPNELAIIDGSGMTPWVGNKRINVSGQYQKFRGLRITGFPENGFLVGTGSHHTTIDGCEIDNCHLSGIMNFNSSDNRYINLHVHDCSDVGGPANGGNADGISVASGSRNYVGNCLVEDCSDDGIDAWQSQDSVFEFNIVRGCGLGDGNGNGFKCGGADIGANAMVNNNLAYNNRALGFDVNTGINVTFKNNTSYNNGAQGYGLESDTIAINNVSSGDGSIKYGTGIPTNNSWNIGGTLTFISTTEGNANFLKVTQGGSFDGIGWEYI